MEKILRRTLVILIYIGLILINTKVYATQVGTPIKDNVRIRKETSTDSGIVENVSSNDEITIISKENNWYKVEFEKGEKTYSGYIRADLLEVKDEENKEDEGESSNSSQDTEQTQNKDSENNASDSSESTKATKNIEIKEGYTAKSNNQLQIKLVPTINSEYVDKIKQGIEYKVIEVVNKWAYIETENQSGWILKSKLDGSTSVAKEDNVEQKVEEEVEKQEENKNDEKVEENNSKEAENNKEEEKTQESNSDNKNREESETEKNTENRADNKSEENKNETKYVSAETLNVREKPSSTAKVINQLDVNDKVNVLEKVDDTWTKIQSGEVTGYVASKFLSDKKTVITSRSGDTTRENQEAEDNKEDAVGQENNSNDNTNSEKTQENTQSKNENTSNSSKASNNSTTGASVVEYAKQYLGYKYVSGGASPSTGFDCSGFTTYVFKHFGISLSRTSGAQASNGTKVEKSNLQPGDILIFNDSANSKVGHVGIYIGGNQFIHAANARKGVIITSLSDSYYSARYVGARRVL